MKVVPTELHVWKVWLNAFIHASDSNKWYLYVLAPTASRAAKISVTYWKQHHSAAIVVAVELVCSSVVLEPAMITRQCAKYEKEREEETQWRKYVEAGRESQCDH